MKNHRTGILVYVDNAATMLEEFSWLYKSLIFSGATATCDLIAVCHPDALKKLPSNDRIRYITALPFADEHAAWSDYKFINSVANLVSPAVFDLCREYEYILKTDCDTFVTSALVEFEPSGLCLGFGAYAYSESVRRKLAECSERWGFPHNGTHNVGASVLGPTEMVLNFLASQMENCERLLQEEFADFTGEWPGWSKQVLTMYAGELALRLTYPQRCSLGLLDHFTSGDRKIASDVLHIHAWHTDSYWSKHDFRAGNYGTIELGHIDRTTLGGYCHWLAAATLDEVKAAARTLSR
ncbi:hypothetical protein [Caballeronia sp. ATUFL_F1_KS39]|uniref:DUF7164 domain-containing protein n=1 Tax=Caballeronia sp. ATUFL_F1_KS39 TaxID=2921766 RepID=UPI002028573C